MASFKINGREVKVDAEPDAPLLWVIREHLKMTGTKFGCGIAQCGACTVHLNGQVVRSCSVPMSLVEGGSVTTIEGLKPELARPLQEAWIAEQVPQCGYCQSGQIMEAAALIEKHPHPTREQIVDTMTTHICRCVTYSHMLRAIERAAQARSKEAGPSLGHGTKQAER